MNTTGCIFIKQKDYFNKVLFNNILYVEASGSYCILHLDGGSDLIVSYTLSEFVEYLASSRFLRVHRSFAINMERIDGYAGNSFQLGNRQIPIGRLYKKDVLTQFNMI